ncbi:MAG: FAD-dependent oxidoreductase [Spirochaetaceae bacterium]|nr:MAG: FAD-dependent oxidoreductase [Spirochaetaceae bacterium]
MVIGGGGTGAALAYDLSLRGCRVTLFERGELTSGTTGRHHGQLHCGARYAVQDREIGRECMRESEILRRIAPASIEFNHGLFVAITEEDEQYCRTFFPACQACGIPARLLTAAQALAMEPYLNPRLRLAVQVPDGSMDAWRMALQFFASAKARGADIRNFSEVIGLKVAADGEAARSSRIIGVRIRDHRSGSEYELTADLVINATGAWSKSVVGLAGIDIAVSPSPGTMVAVKGRLTNMVISRLHPAADGDIIVPQRNLSIIGTTQRLTADPDRITVPHRDVEKMLRSAEIMVPGFKKAPFHAAWAAARPLVGEVSNSVGVRDLSRDFSLIDHGEAGGVGRFLSIIGGKATTLRGMAEITADRSCELLGIESACRTAELPLLPARSLYRGRAGVSAHPGVRAAKTGNLPAKAATESRSGERNI